MIGAGDVGRARLGALLRRRRSAAAASPPAASREPPQRPIRAARQGHYRELVHYGVSDERAAAVGLTCGGEIDVLVEPDVPAEVINAAANDRALAVATPLPVGREASEAGRVLLDARGIRSGSLGDAAADADLVDLARDALRAGVSRTIRIGTRDLYVDVVAAARLVIVGAGEIAVYLVRLAHAIGLPHVVDRRAGRVLVSLLKHALY